MPANHKNLYTCGPTVYNFAHIGNLRSYVFADIIYRSEKFRGHKVFWVINITDVDDKTIKNTQKEFGEGANLTDLKKYTDKFYQAFLSDLVKLNVSTQDIRFIKVSEVIPEIQDFIVKLIEKKYAYKADDGSTYFDIEKYQNDFGHYGHLVGEKFLEGKKIGAGATGSPQARIKADEYDKENLNDFALWKGREKADANIFWPHPLLGEGRPGWHIECSAINKLAFMGEATDIHTGGVDLIFPHHTNEIAQSEALTGQPFVIEWRHSEHILVDGQKMSKSLGNLFSLTDLENKNFDPLAYRYLLLQTGYKQKVNFTWESLEASAKGYNNLKKKIANIKKQVNLISRIIALLGQTPATGKPGDYINDFTNKISDLNTASALATLQAVIADDQLTPVQKIKLVAKFDLVLGLSLI